MIIRINACLKWPDTDPITLSSEIRDIAHSTICDFYRVLNIPSTMDLKQLLSMIIQITNPT